MSLNELVPSTAGAQGGQMQLPGLCLCQVAHQRRYQPAVPACQEPCLRVGTMPGCHPQGVFKPKQAPTKNVQRMARSCFIPSLTVSAPRQPCCIHRASSRNPECCPGLCPVSPALPASVLSSHLFTIRTPLFAVSACWSARKGLPNSLSTAILPSSKT